MNVYETLRKLKDQCLLDGTLAYSSPERCYLLTIKLGEDLQVATERLKMLSASPRPTPPPVLVRSAYVQAKPLMRVAIEGYVASHRAEFPPYNPYAPMGLIPGDEEQNPVGGAWFYGYWERSYCKNGEQPVFPKEPDYVI